MNVLLRMWLPAVLAAALLAAFGVILKLRARNQERHLMSSNVDADEGLSFDRPIPMREASGGLTVQDVIRIYETYAPSVRAFEEAQARTHVQESLPLPITTNVLVPSA